MFYSWIKHLIFLSLLLTINHAFANQTPNILESYHPHMLFQIGGFNADQGKAQHINHVGLIGDNFSVRQHTDQNLLVGVGYYFDAIIQPTYKVLFGLNGFYLAQTWVKGRITQENLFTNLKYHYAIDNYPLYLASRLLIDCQTDKLPRIILDGGLGVNFIKTKHFQDRSIDGGITLPNNNFSNHRSTSPSATLGVGMQILQLEHDIALELGYRFFYLGEGELQPKAFTLSHLKTGHSFAHAIILTLSV